LPFEPDLDYEPYLDPLSETPPGAEAQATQEEIVLASSYQ